MKDAEGWLPGRSGNCHYPRGSWKSCAGLVEDNRQVGLVKEGGPTTINPLEGGLLKVLVCIWKEFWKKTKRSEAILLCRSKAFGGSETLSHFDLLCRPDFLQTTRVKDRIFAAFLGSTHQWAERFPTRRRDTKGSSGHLGSPLHEVYECSALLEVQTRQRG